MTDKEKIKSEFEKRSILCKKARIDLRKDINIAYYEGKETAYNEAVLYIDSLQEEPVSEDLKKAVEDYSNNLDNIRGSIGEMVRNAYKAGAEWRKEQITKVLLSEVLPYFMRGGEVYEVVDKLDEVLNQKK